VSGQLVTTGHGWAGKGKEINWRAGLAGPWVIFARGYIGVFMMNLMYEHCGRRADRIDAYCMIGRECIHTKVTTSLDSGEGKLAEPRLNLSAGRDDAFVLPTRTQLM
jgi:hypothetical protein